jgi:hypothetical protein
MYTKITNAYRYWWSWRAEQNICEKSTGCINENLDIKFSVHDACLE